MRTSTLSSCDAPTGFVSTVLNDWGGEVVWVDARKRAEWEKNGIPGSVLVNTDPAACMTARETKFSEAMRWTWER